MRKVMGVELTVEQLDKQVEAIMGDVSTSKSGKMKLMFGCGMDVKEIAAVMGVRYNFVYNVVSNMIIVEGVEVEQDKKVSKKDLVWELLDQGETVKSIAITLKTNYNYIYKLKKEWEVNAEAEVVEMEKDEVAK